MKNSDQDGLRENQIGRNRVIRVRLGNDVFRILSIGESAVIFEPSRSSNIQTI